MTANAASRAGNGISRAAVRRLAPALAAMSLLLGLAVTSAASAAADPQLAKLIASPERTPEFAARDRYRHPLQTLSFFGIKPTMTVVEIWPGGGWYTEILAPYLRDRGHYIAAGPVGSGDVSEAKKKAVAKFAEKLAQKPALYDRAKVVEFGPPSFPEIAPAGSVDMVLTFRNVHNWIAAEYEQQAFNQFYAALKPGGILGVEEHRAEPDATIGDMKQYGYVTEDYIKQLADNAGFKFAGSSPVNNNPADTKNYPDGVWTLPPTLTLGDKDRDRYLAIGESDRMTLKFVKPR